MQKKVVQEALELTRECLSRYWKLDPELVISCCAEDVLWTGALQKQFIVGKEATAEDLRGTMRDLKPSSDGTGVFCGTEYGNHLYGGWTVSGYNR